MKVGDKVICVSKPPNNTFLVVGRFYIISEMYNTLLLVEGNDQHKFYHERFKKIDDNAINRLLYPEAFDGENI